MTLIAATAGPVGNAKADEPLPDSSPEPTPTPSAAPTPDPLAPVPYPNSSPHVDLRYNMWIDGAVTFGQAAALGAYVLFARDDLLGFDCRWCDGPRPNVNAVDQFFRDTFYVQNQSFAMKFMGNAVSWVLAPIAINGTLWLAARHDGQGNNFWVDGLLVGEATMTAVALSEIIKGITLRERPGVHAIVDEQRHEEEKNISGSNLSFPAGHTLAIAALTSSAGVVAAMRRYRWTPVVWVVGSVLTATTAYFRIAADQHYFTDTLGAAAIGGGVGVAMPLLFHGPKPPPGIVTSDGRSITLTIGF